MSDSNLRSTQCVAPPAPTPGAGELPERRTCMVLGVRIDALGFDAAQEQLLAWCRHRDSRYVVLANAHVVALAGQDAAFAVAVSSADMTTADGAPVAWMMRKLGYAMQPRVSGPDLMLAMLGCCVHEGLTVYLYGSSPTTLQALTQRVKSEFPALKLVGAESPPFRAMSPKEDDDTVQRINDSGASLVFVGLGCPKQEIWMAARRGKIRAVMVGVGAAFDYHSGNLQRAPRRMQDTGLEWFYRLLREPRRLWKRYLLTNTLFARGALRQLSDLRNRDSDK